MDKVICSNFIWSSEKGILVHIFNTEGADINGAYDQHEFALLEKLQLMNLWYCQQTGGYWLHQTITHNHITSVLI